MKATSISWPACRVGGREILGLIRSSCKTEVRFTPKTTEQRQLLPSLFPVRWFPVRRRPRPRLDSFSAFFRFSP